MSKPPSVAMVLPDPAGTSAKNPCSASSLPLAGFCLSRADVLHLAHGKFTTHRAESSWT